MYTLNTKALMAAVAAAATTVAAKAATQQVQRQNDTEKVQTTHAHGAAHAGRVYVVGSVQQAPTAAIQARWMEQGIKVLGFLRANQYFLSFPESMSAGQLAKAGIVRTREFYASEKVGAAFLNRSIPAHAVRGNMTASTVVLFNGVDKNEIKEELAQKGFTFEADKTPGNTFTVVGTMAQLMDLANEGFVQAMDYVSGSAQLEDLSSRVATRSNVLLGAYRSQRRLNGNGVEIANGDLSEISMHPDFKGRVFNAFTGSAQNSHATMSAGVIGGAGNINPFNMGIVPRARMTNYDASNNLQLLNTGINFQGNNTIITNTAYGTGCNTGYNIEAYSMDQIVNMYPQVLHVFSAGNEGMNTCGSASPRGFSTITGGFKAAKNVMTVGNVWLNGQIDTLSSKGPTRDGRVKPEIVAVGNGQMTLGLNGYQAATGTSAASGVVTGIAAQLAQAYRTANRNANPPAALMKAILLNTADDKGNVGPDYTYGFGMVNAWKAVEAIEGRTFREGTLNATGDSMVFTLAIPANTQQTKLMLYWQDQEAQANSAKALVNDLDLTASRFNYAENFQPLVLDPTSNRITAQAAAGVDTLNNVEQIVIDTPSAGNIRVVVSASNLALGNQKFYLVFTHYSNAVRFAYPFGGESLTPYTNEVISWEGMDGAAYYNLDYSVNGGSWTPVARNLAGTAKSYVWNVPNFNAGRVKLRLSSDKGLVYSGEFSAVLRPTGLKVDWFCSDSAQISWDAQAGATGYAIYKLGDYVMDSLGTTTNNRYVINTISPNIDQVFAISAIGQNDGLSMRSNAVTRLAAASVCPSIVDLSVSEILTPALASIAACQGTQAQVKVMVVNKGLRAINQAPIDLVVNGSVVATDTIRTLIESHDSIEYTFVSPVLIPSTNFTLAANVRGAGDGDVTNNQLLKNMTIKANSATSLPYVENFNAQPLHTSNPSTIQFALVNGLHNENNGSADQVDFRVFNKQTPTAFTGPLADRSGKGNYAYLEADQANGNTAILTTPCFNLTSTQTPMVEFYTHMNGANMGELHLDAVIDGRLVKDIATPLFGSQGNDWVKMSANLAAYKNNTVVLAIRAKVGNGNASDIAIDDIRVYDAQTAPVAGFITSSPTTCTGKAIQLKGQAVNATAHNWNITPAQATFVQGTTSTSEAPEVEFSANGTYTVTYTVTNVHGTDVATQTIEVTNGKALPTLQNLSDGMGNGWNILNADDAETFELESTIGSAGYSTSVIRVDNTNNATRTSEDVFESPAIDLTATNNGKFSFDYSYRFNQVNADSLVVLVSSNCGTTWWPVWANGGQSLNTSTQGNGRFIPGTAGEWRRATIDLSAYVGSSIKVRLVNINYNGQPIYLDNLYFGTTPFAYANDLSVTGLIGISNNDVISQNDKFVTMVIKNNGNVTIGAGFQVAYAIDGAIIATETVNRNVNEGDTIHYTLRTAVNASNVTGRLAPSMRASFFTLVNNDVNTANDSSSVILRSSLSSNQVPADQMGVTIYPNPSNGVVSIKNNGFQSLQIHVLDVSGKLVRQFNQMGNETRTLDLSSEAKGIYFIQMTNGTTSSTEKVLIY